MIEHREGETLTAFTMRRIRAEILEQAAVAAEEEAHAKPHSMYFRAGCLSAAKRIRKMAEE